MQKLTFLALQAQLLEPMQAYLASVSGVDLSETFLRFPATLLGCQCRDRSELEQFLELFLKIVRDITALLI